MVELPRGIDNFDGDSLHNTRAGNQNFCRDRDRSISLRREGLGPAHQREESTPHNLGMDAMSQTLHQISKFTFSTKIEISDLRHRFVQIAFVNYNGKSDPIKLVSHFN